MESAPLSPKETPIPRPGLPSSRPLPVDKRTRVLVVDDSYFMQRRLAEIIQSAPDLRVIGFADNGAEAIRLAETLAPDVITMDINMPKCDGLYAIDYIMRSNPRPIVIVSSYTPKSSRAAIYGLELGVVDIVEKPSTGGVALDIMEKAAELITKVRTAARVRVVRTLHGATEELPRMKPLVPEKIAECAVPSESFTLEDFPNGLPQVIAIGASTGGPLVLQELLKAVPTREFPPVVIVQHLPAKFTHEMALQLNAVSSLEVKEAQDGQMLTRGTAYIAPGGFHLQVNSEGALVIHDGPPRHHCKPSVDELFHSLARNYGPRVLAFVLTGMGEDGAAGALAIKQAGGVVVAQDEASSVVFGMPAAAVKAGGVHQVLSLEKLKQLFSQLGQKVETGVLATAHLKA